MRLIAALSGPRLIIAMLFALAPGLASAGGAFIMKGGSVRLTDDSQSLDFQNRTFDDTSHNTLGFNIEARKRGGVAFGAEFLTFRHDFTPPANEKGESQVWTLQFVGKKYFIEHGPVHPFIGAGFGVARVRYEYRDGLGEHSDNEFALALQAALGLELRFDNLSFTLEAKNMYYDIEGGGNEFDPSSIAVLAGFGFNW